MHAFIVRPFGPKRGVDFDCVERDLIAPALSRLNVTGRTTTEITHAGNIRADMFQLLLTADLVVVDISIHNANVFYELGVRHALRDQRTFLLSANIDEAPFNLRTDRYLSYDATNPGAKLEELIEGLAATLRSKQPDSPVFALAPGLRANDPSDFIIVPRDFREEVELAFNEREAGDLCFLSAETSGLAWRREGLRVVAEYQFRLDDFIHSAINWEAVRNEVPDHVMSNLRLGTIYRKLGNLTLSDQALERVLECKDLAPGQLAEAHALLASNAKTRWMAQWSGLSADARAAGALASPYLFESFEEYLRGFEADLNQFYPGLNALAMITVITELAGMLPEVWKARHEDETEAAFRLRELNKAKARLAGAVDLSLKAYRQGLDRAGRKDAWHTASVADYSCLMGKPTVVQDYRNALAGIDPFSRDSIRRQLEIYDRLGVLTGAVRAVLPLFAPLSAGAATSTRPAVILFTGHRIDEADRAGSRFPANQEPTVRAAIRSAVQDAVNRTKGPLIGISGGASGGDLLFLEVCEELGIPRRLFLIIPRADYVRESVAPAGADWVRRFDHQYSAAAPRVYQSSTELPNWLQAKPDYGIWQRSNMWMLYNALWQGGANILLIALWDGTGGEGPGGTEHMVESAKAQGAQTVVLDIKKLFSVTS